MEEIGTGHNILVSLKSIFLNKIFLDIVTIQLNKKTNYTYVNNSDLGSKIMVVVTNTGRIIFKLVD
jgi:hypothetical protein